MSEPSKANMWSYWRDKYGFVSALVDYYPNLIKGDIIIAAAYAQIKMANMSINARMEELADQEEEG